MVKLSESFDFGQNFLKFSIYSTISKNFDFGQIIEKFRFLSKFSKISKNNDFSKIIEKFIKWFWSNFSKISILVKFSKYYVVGQIFEKNFDFEKCGF